MNEIRTSPGSAPKARVKRDKTDWPGVYALTDAEIGAAVADDPDTFVPDRAWMENAAVVMPEAKDMVTLRIDHDVLTWFKTAGRGYQTRINAVLRAFYKAQGHRTR